MAIEKSTTTPIPSFFNSWRKYTSLETRDSSTLTMSQQNALLVVERTSSMLSIAASSFVLLTFVLSARLRRRSFNRLLFLATWGNLFSNVATFIGHDGIIAGTGSGVCKVQGMLIQWFLPADSLWTFCMAVNVFLTFQTSQVSVKIRKLEKWYFLVCYGIPAIPALFYLISDVAGGSQYYGDATLWCWISTQHDILRIATFYAPVWITIAVTMSLYAITGRAIYQGEVRNKAMQKALEDRKSALAILDLDKTASVQVHKRLDIEQTSEILLSADSTSQQPTARSSSNTTPAVELSTSPSLRTSTLVGKEDRIMQSRSKSFMSASITTVVSSTTAEGIIMDKEMIIGKEVESPRPSPKHQPITVPAFGNGISKPTSIPLENLPPNSRISSAVGINNRNNSTAVVSSSFSTTSSTRSKKSRVAQRSHATTYARVAFALYIIMLIIWVPSTVNRVYGLINAEHGSDKVDVPLNVTAAFVLPLQGLFNAVIYGFVGRRDIAMEWRGRWRRMTNKGAKSKRKSNRSGGGFSQRRMEDSNADIDEDLEAQGSDDDLNDDAEELEIEEIVPPKPHKVEESGVSDIEELVDWPLRPPPSLPPLVKQVEEEDINDQKPTTPVMFSGIRIPSPTIRM